MSSFCRMSDNLDTSEQRHLSCRRCWVGDHAPFSDSQYTITHKSCSDVYIKPKVKPDVQVTQVSQHCAMCRKQPLSRNTVATNLYQCLNRNCSWTCDQHHLKINSVRKPTPVVAVLLALNRLYHVAICAVWKRMRTHSHTQDWHTHDTHQRQRSYICLITSFL